MTVQISVTVWAVLCFLALMAILDRMLFRPLLTFMDERKEKIRQAREAKEEALRRQEEELALRKQRKAEAERRALSESMERLEVIRQESSEESHRQSAENARRLEELKETLEQESLEIRRRLSPRIDALSAAFAEGLEIVVDTERSPSDAEVAAPHAELHHDNI